MEQGGIGMKVSACVITKNEEKNIGKWLQEMSLLADEMIVVDTGSTDSTVNMAKKAGAKVFNFEWINDFSAAKNYAIEKATGDWILFLDADEYFTEATRKNVRPLLETNYKKDNVGSIRCRLTNIDVDRKNKIVDAMVQVRIFKNIPQIRYHGKIHENIKNTGKAIGMIFSNDIEIYHTGYSSSIIKSKSERNLKFLLEKKEIEGDSTSVISGLMDSYMTLGNYEEAYKYAKMAVERNIVFFGLEGHEYEILINSLAQLVSKGKEPIEKLFQAMDRAMEVYPKEPSFPLGKGYVLWQIRDYLTAKQYLEKGFKIRDDFEAECIKGLGINDSSQRILPMAYEAMGNILYMQKKGKEAAETFVKGIGYYKYYEPLLLGLYLCIKDSEAVSIIQAICFYYNKDADAEFISNALKDTADYQVYEYFAKRVNKKISDAEKMLANKNYDSAAILLASKMKRSYNLGKICLEKGNSTKLKWIKELLPNNYKSNDTVNIYSVNRLMKEMNTLKLDNDKEPLVSIMIPTYNRPKFFEKTLKSALNQTYKNIEIIVNDNSTNDDTEMLMQKYLVDKRIRYFRNYKAKSKEANFIPFKEQARGSLLQWCMDDDILAPDKLSKMVPVLRDNKNITLVTSMRNFIDSDDNIIDNELRYNLNLSEEINGLKGEFVGYNTLTRIANFIGEPSATLFRRKDLKNHYWKAESKGLYAISDVAMWLELMEIGNIVIFKEPLSYYRYHVQQEGQIPEVCLLSRMEWKKLIDEYYERGIFLHTREDYLKGLRKMYEEYVKYYSEDSTLVLSQYTSAKNYQEYKETMLSIAEIL